MSGSLNINRRRFFMTGGIGFSVMVVLLVSLMITGTVFAAFPLAGIGGFVIEAENIYGEGFELIPAVNDINEGDGEGSIPTGDYDPNAEPVWAQSQSCMDEVDITDLNLYKFIDVTHIVPETAEMPLNYIKINVKGDSASGEGLVMHATEIQAGEAIFEEMLMDENLETDNAYFNKYVGSVTPDPFDDGDMAEIGIKADKVTLANANINAHYMKVTKMSIPNMQLCLEYYTGNNVQLEPSGDAPWYDRQ